MLRRAVATGDFDQDNNMDIIFQHADGTLAVWYLDEIELKNAALLEPANPGDASWRVVATADFDGDQKPDLVFPHHDGTLAVWLMQGAVLKDGRLFSPSNPGSGWRVVSAVDRNNDGKPDLLFQHTNLDLAVWFMDGTTLEEARFLEPRNPGGTWKVVAPR